MRRFPILFLSLFPLLLACDSDPSGPKAEEETMEGAGIVAGAPSMNESAVEYLVNGDMETDEGWWFNGPEMTTQSFSTAAANSGLRSVALAMPTTTDLGGFTYAGQYVPVSDPSEDKFVLTVRMKLDGVTGQGAAIAVRGDTEAVPSGWAEAFATTQGTLTLTGTSEWTEVTVELDGLRSDIRSVTVYLLLLSESSGTVYFDDAVLEMQNSTPIRTIMNGGFEFGAPWPTYWWHGGSNFSHFGFHWPEEGAFAGTRYVSIERWNNAPGEFAFFAQTISAEDFRGGPATLRVMIRTDLIGKGAAIAIRGDDTVQPSGRAESFATTEERIPISGTQDWTEYAVTMDEVPATTRSLTIYLIYADDTTGTVAFDEVSLSDQPIS